MDGLYTVNTASPAIAAKPIGAWDEDALREAMKADARKMAKVGEGQYRQSKSMGGLSKADAATRDRKRRWKASLRRFQDMLPHMDIPKTVAQISVACGLPTGETGGTMKALHKRGIVEKVGTTANTGKTPIWLWALAEDWFSKIGGE